MQVNVPSNENALTVVSPVPVRYMEASALVSGGTSCEKRPSVATKSESPGTTIPLLISVARFCASTFGFWNSARRCGVRISLAMAIGPMDWTIMCFSGEKSTVVARNLLSPRVFQ